MRTEEVEREAGSRDEDGNWVEPSFFALLFFFAFLCFLWQGRGGAGLVLVVVVVVEVATTTKGVIV